MTKLFLEAFDLNSNVSKNYAIEERKTTDCGTALLAFLRNNHKADSQLIKITPVDPITVIWNSTCFLRI